METSQREGAGAEREDARRGFKPFGQPWLVVSFVLLAAAAVLLYLSQPNATFVVAALGVLAWFLNVRANLQQRHTEKEINRDGQDKQDKSSDE